MTIRVRAANDAVTKWIRGRDWANISQTYRSRNPICQAIVDGEQCHAPAELVHHIVSPAENWDIRHDWKNLVSLCMKHHTPHAGGLHYDFTPSVLFDGSEFEHASARANVLVPTGEKGLQFIAGTPDDAKMAELMADVQDLNVDDLLK